MTMKCGFARHTIFFKISDIFSHPFIFFFLFCREKMLKILYWVVFVLYLIFVRFDFVFYKKKISRHLHFFCGVGCLPLELKLAGRKKKETICRWVLVANWMDGCLDVCSFVSSCWVLGAVFLFVCLLLLLLFLMLSSFL